MQKKSALDRDQILLSESQEDYQFKRDLYEVICQLNELFAQPTKKSVSQCWQWLQASPNLLKF